MSRKRLCCEDFEAFYSYCGAVITDTPDDNDEFFTHPYSITEDDGNYALISYCPFCGADLKEGKS